MFKLNVEGLRINQYRLFHSKKFRGFNFIKIRNSYSDQGDLTSEKNVITDYLVEKNEMDLTYYLVYSGISVFLMCLVVLFMLSMVSVASINGILLLASVMFFIVSRKRKEDFVAGEMGIDMSEDFFNNKIREKFNL